MENFLTKIWPANQYFEKFELTGRIIVKVKDEAVKDLNVRDYFQLKDRFEGVAFLEKAIQKTAPFIFFNKKMGLPIPYSNYGDSKKYASIELQDKCYEIVVFSFGETPKLKLIKKNCPCLVFIQKNEKVFYFCGLIEVGTKGLSSTHIDFSLLDFSYDLIPFEVV